MIREFARGLIELGADTGFYATSLILPPVTSVESAVQIKAYLLLGKPNWHFDAVLETRRENELAVHRFYELAQRTDV